MSQDARDEYLNALRKGRLIYFSRITRGKPGFILSLEDLASQMEIVSEINVGYEKVPINKVIGTWSRSRATMFTKNFLPLATNDKSEFAVKWINLFEAHMIEGIRDAVKLYEYLNWYYVIEGNKRVSVLNYVKAKTIEAHVVRLMPRKEPMTPEKKAYFDFLDFRNSTGIRDIWLDRKGGYKILEKKFKEYTPPEDRILADTNEHILKNIYQPFRDIFHSLGAQKKLRMTTGDAFLRYVEIFQMPEKIETEKAGDEIKRLLDDLILEEAAELEKTDTEEIALKERSPIEGIYSLFTGKKTLRVLFLYSREPDKSGWSFAHEQGRQFVQQELGDQIITDSIAGLPEDDGAYDEIFRGIQKGYDVIFATSPLFGNPIIKASIKHPDAMYYLCSPEKSRQRVRTYFGQSFESSFLAGILASLMSEDGRLGYIATGTGVEPYFRINSFVQGARLIDPDCHIPLLWNPFWDNPEYARNLAGKLLSKHCSIIFQHSLPVPGLTTDEYGLYDLSGKRENPARQFGYTSWNWGKLYLRILENILSGSGSQDGYQQNLTSSVPLNFWGGLRSETVDFLVNKDNVPFRTQQLIELLRNNVIHNQIHPFTGPLFDNKGNLQIPGGEEADLNTIRNMDWLCEGVIDLGDSSSS